LGEVDLEILFALGYLQTQEDVLWSPCYGQGFPTEGNKEQVLFRFLCERGLALPASDSVRELLDFYRLEIHHLTSNGILHIANFVHFFEAFLGIDPSFPFFRFLFRVKAQPSENFVKVVGGAEIQLRQEYADQWFTTPLKNKIDHWDSEWFTIGMSLPRVVPQVDPE
jgi:hypothetical protein